MYKRVVGKCKNPGCKQSFGIVRDLLHDKKGVLKVRCPHCEHFNEIGVKQFNKIVLLAI